MAIITLTELKKYLGSKATEFTDSQLGLILDNTYSIIQQELNVDIFREPLVYISPQRQNTINATNTTFYLNNYINKYLADKNGDGSVTAADFIVYSVASNSPEEIVSVSSVGYTDSSIDLVTAPANVRLFCSYSYSFYDMDIPDTRVKLLAKYLSLYFCYFELEFDLVGTTVKMGNQSISGVNTNSRNSKYKKLYDDLLKDLQAYGTGKNKPTEFNIIKPINYRPDEVYGYRNVNNTSQRGGF